MVCGCKDSISTSQSISEYDFSVINNLSVPSLQSVKAINTIRYNIKIPHSPELEKHSWLSKVRLVTESSLIGSELRKIADIKSGKYPFDEETLSLKTFNKILPYTHVLIAVVENGVNQPAFRYYGHGNVFGFDDKYFHPASLVKPATIIGALIKLKSYGFSSHSIVRFLDEEGYYGDKLLYLIRPVIMHSCNLSYNRLVRLAGFDFLNENVLTSRYGLDNYEIVHKYGSKIKNIKESPYMIFGMDEPVVRFRPKEGKYKPSCKLNCASYFELMEVMRRIHLHKELPAEERFNVHDGDIEVMVNYMGLTRKYNKKAPSAVFGEETDVYNNVGRVPGIMAADNSFIVGKKSRRKVFIIVKVPFFESIPRDSYITADWINDIAAVSLKKVLNISQKLGPPIQHDFPSGVQVELFSDKDKTGLKAIVSGKIHSFDAVRVWIDRQFVGIFNGSGKISAELGSVKSGTHVITFKGYTKEKPSFFITRMIDW